MTTVPTMTGAVRATEILHLERIFQLEQCYSPDCAGAATWNFTTLPCGCVTPLCDKCFTITKRRYQRAKQRMHPFINVVHPRCEKRFKGHEFGFTYTRI